MSGAKVKQLLPVERIEIDPSASLDDQIAAFQLLVDTPPSPTFGGRYNVQIVTYSPEFARWILEERNPSNRTLRGHDVHRYSRAVAAGWADTGDTIKFCPEGILRDGQHRLAACSAAGIPLTSLTVFGIDKRAVRVFDTGRRRTSNDALTVHGVDNGQIVGRATRWVIIMNDPSLGRSYTPENDEIIERYQRLNGSLIQRCARIAKVHNENCGKQRRIPAGLLAAMLYVFHTRDPDAAKIFEQDMLQDRRAAGVLHQKIAAIRDLNPRIHEDVFRTFIILTWNAYRNRAGKLKPSDLSWDRDTPIPAMA